MIEIINQWLPVVVTAITNLSAIFVMIGKVKQMANINNLETDNKNLRHQIRELKDKQDELLELAKKIERHQRGL